MRKSVLSRVPGCLLPFTTIIILVVFSISVFTVEDNDNSLGSPGLQYLSSETQGDDPGYEERGSPSTIDAGTFFGIFEKQCSTDYLPEEEVGLQAFPPTLLSQINRAPPVEQPATNS
jgi:hypothetical protein